MKQITFNEEKGQFILHYQDPKIGDYIVGMLDMCDTLDNMGYVIFDEDNNPVSKAIDILGKSFVKLGKVHYPNEERIMDYFMDNAIEYANENARAYEMDRGII